MKKVVGVALLLVVAVFLLPFLIHRGMEQEQAADPAAQEKLERQEPRAAQTARYVRDYAPAPVFDGTAVRYYPSGEAMFADMLPACVKISFFDNLKIPSNCSAQSSIVIGICSSARISARSK